MTTSQPSLAQEIHQAAAARGVFSVDAPVSGGDVGARELAFVHNDRRRPVGRGSLASLLGSTLGKTIVYQGGPGAGQHAKMVNQVLIATNMIGVALLYAYRAGLDLETVMRSVTSGAANSWSLSNLGPRIIQNNFDPGFFVEHFIKDMGIALEEAGRMRLSLPGLALAHQLYVAVQALGHGRQGTRRPAASLRIPGQPRLVRAGVEPGSAGGTAKCADRSPQFAASALRSFTYPTATIYAVPR